MVLLSDSKFTPFLSPSEATSTRAQSNVKKESKEKKETTLRFSSLSICQFCCGICLKRSVARLCVVEQNPALALERRDSLVPHNLLRCELSLNQSTLCLVEEHEEKR